MDIIKNLPRYQVPVLDNQGKPLFAYIEESKQEDMPNRDLVNWTCDWKAFWADADFNYEAIIKLHYQGKVLGLVRTAFYPCEVSNPEYAYISHIECLKSDKRLINPIGQWLIWYVIKISLKYCTGNEPQGLLTLDALEEAIPYYRDKVKMEAIGWANGAPGEDLYAFKFTKEEAEQFCRRLEGHYGRAISI